MAQRPPPRGPAVNTAPLSVSSEAGRPWAPAASWNAATTSAALLTEVDDLLLQGFGDPLRARPWPTGARLETRLALCFEAADQLVHPPPGQSVVAGDRGLRASFERDRGDHEPCQRHPSTP